MNRTAQEPESVRAMLDASAPLLLAIEAAANTARKIAVASSHQGLPVSDALKRLRGLHPSHRVVLRPFLDDRSGWRLSIQAYASGHRSGTEFSLPLSWLDHGPVRAAQAVRRSHRSGMLSLLEERRLRLVQTHDAAVRDAARQSRVAEDALRKLDSLEARRSAVIGQYPEAKKATKTKKEAASR